MKKQFRLTALSAAVIAIASLSGCATTADHSTANQAEQMRTIFTDYQTAVNDLDSTSFGQISDQMAASRQTLDRLYLEKLSQLDRSELTDEDKVYFDTFLFDRDIAIRGASLANSRFGNPDVPVTHFYNYMEWNAEEAGATAEDAEGYTTQLTMLREYTSWVKNFHSQYSLGATEQIQLPKVLIKRFNDSSKGTIASDDYAMLKQGLNDIVATGTFDKAFVTEYTEAVAQAETATHDFIDYIATDYMASARGTGKEGSVTDKNIGWGALPNGQAWYQWHLDRNSTTGKSAAELSAMGEELVADAKAEMIRVAKVIVSKHGKSITADFRDPKTEKTAPRTFVIADANNNINLNEFFAYLNSEKFFFGRDGSNVTGTQYAEECKVASNPSSCESSLTDYYLFKNNANEVVKSYFNAIETDYTIIPSPAGRELYDGVASYDSNEFTLNTNPDYSLQKWNVSTLLLHEAAPGHHFQNAYATEYPPADKPDYMKDVWYTAYGEGWALYTEWLGAEMKIYGELDSEGKPTFVNGTGMCTDSNDYSNFQGGIYKDAEECNALQYFGSLNEAQLRNMRLAVDTGIHAKGWSIQEARDYMKANSALGQGDIASESYRYAAHVGQAVSYKSGFLVIRDMLLKAQSELGDKFDWAEFHDQLLKYADQPMEVIETSITNWIKAKK
ncbi:DUF885 domain-containing protein [Aliivibrio kagoshimensis]|uniref:DUF885 domain-containing protein n=1 Tax=Aliivibrio kagoshimensis TaxID=2910230 RepID=UPI003D0AC320